MSDPYQRARLLLDAARHGDDPAPGLERRIERKLMKRVALGAAAGGAITAKATGASVLVSVAKATALGITVGAAALVGTGGFRTPDVRPAPAARVAPAAKAAHPAAASVRRAAPEIITEPDVEPIARPRASASEVKSQQAEFVDPVDPAPVEPTDPLHAEAAGLRAAHEAIQAGSPERALALIAEQERTFRAGALTEERAAVRVLALCRLGHAAEARAAAAQFLATFPHSPLVPRVRALCAEPVP